MHQCQDTFLPSFCPSQNFSSEFGPSVGLVGEKGAFCCDDPQIVGGLQELFRGMLRTAVEKIEDLIGEDQLFLRREDLSSRYTFISIQIVSLPLRRPDPLLPAVPDGGLQPAVRPPL